MTNLQLTNFSQLQLRRASPPKLFPSLLLIGYGIIITRYDMPKQPLKAIVRLLRLSTEELVMTI
jgi:hypothetical protein